MSTLERPVLRSNAQQATASASCCEPGVFGSRIERRLRELESELATVRLGDRSDRENLDGVIAAVRELTELDGVALFTIRHAAGRWALERMHHAGTALRRMEHRLHSSLARSAQSPFPFDPLRVPSDQRDRLVDARRWVESNGAAAWHRTRFVAEVLEPLGLAAHHQRRALLCEGSMMVGWFGAFHSAPPHRYQQRVLSRLVLPVRERTLLEQRLHAGPTACMALDAMLERIGTPGFVLDARGTVSHANAAGRALLDDRRRGMAGALADAIAHKHAHGFDVTPLHAGGRAAGWLVVMRDESIHGRIAVCVQKAARRWRLTPQQSRVLERMIRGQSNAEIAATLGVSERAIEMHITGLFDKIDVDGRAAMVAAVLLTP